MSAGGNKLHGRGIIVAPSVKRGASLEIGGPRLARLNSGLGMQADDIKGFGLGEPRREHADPLANCSHGTLSLTYADPTARRYGPCLHGASPVGRCSHRGLRVAAIGSTSGNTSMAEFSAPRKGKLWL